MRILNKEDYQKNRIPLYIQGLDEQMQGGIPEGHTVLIAGYAGTMKSTVCFNVLYNEAMKGNASVYFSLEQSYENFIHHLFNLGFDLSKVNFLVLTDLAELDKDITEVKNDKKGSIFFIDISAIRKELKKARTKEGNWVTVIQNITKKLKTVLGLKIMVLDSMSALYIHGDFSEPRKKIFFIFETFRDMGITSYFITEMMHDKKTFAEYGVEDFLADGVVVLDLAERHRKVSREISIAKMRGTKCNHDIFNLEFKKGRFQALYGGEIPLIE